MAVNAFTDMTDEEFLASRTGLAIPEKRSKQFENFKFYEVPKRSSSKRNLKEEKQQIDEIEPVEVPMYKNWAEEGAVTTPYDQSGCGGCWAFATASTCETLAFLSGHDKTL